MERVAHPADAGAVSLPRWYRNALATSDLIGRRLVFFVTGCQKSGTTWIQQLLDAHPNVRCGGEAHLADVIGPMIQQLVRLYNEEPRTGVTLSRKATLCLARMMADQVLGGYMTASRDPDAVLAIGDKTPESSLGMQPLAVLYPGSKFIHVIRDGRDAAVSGWAHVRRQGKADGFRSFAEYAAYFARSHWRPYITSARASAAELEGRCLEVRYEDLHAEPVPVTRRMLEFLAVEAGDATVSACIESASFERLSGGRTRGREDPASHYRKGIVGDWRNHFDQEALEAFDAEAGDLLGELGYAEKAGSILSR